MEEIFIRVAQLILSLSILVIIHECGHFLFARLFKVRVEKFYLFFNPWFSLFKYKPKKSETEYGIGWLPLGGYVKIAGMLDESMDKEALKQPPQPWEFRTKPAWQRLLIMVGGVLMNFLLAFFVFAMLVFTFGEEYIPVRNVKMGFSYNELFLDAGFKNGDIPVSADGVSLSDIDIRRNVNKLLHLLEAKNVQVLRGGELVTINLPKDFGTKNISEKSHIDYRYPFIIKAITNGSPAQEAPLEEGDSIVGINEQSDMFARDVLLALDQYKGTAITLKLWRKGEMKEIAITPTLAGKIGVAFCQPEEIYETVVKKYSFFSAFPAGIRIGVDRIQSYVMSLKYLFTKAGLENVGGFGAIAQVFPVEWHWGAFWEMTAVLSIMLGVMNLLPIPALDGGHVIFLIYEAVSGRKPSDKFLEYAQTIGMILLLALLLYANGMDILRAIGGKGK